VPGVAPVEEQTPTRDRILFTAAELFRRQGYAGTGLKQIVSQSAAPFGSVYHHFPGGKEQLADEVLRTGGAFFLALYEAIVAAEPGDIAAGVDAFFRGAGETLQATDYADACPIATVAGEIASTHDGLRRATADVFTSWLDALAEDLREAGASAQAARDTALAVLAALEGAFLLCRALRDLDPMRAARLAAVRLVKEAIEP
jgi:AcrR family transcriptional regulator